jgi:hypothetical protein
MNKRQMVIVIVVCMMAILVSSASIAMAQDTRPCVTHREYKKVEIGDTMSYVHRLFDTEGRPFFNARAYDKCRSGWVIVGYDESGYVTGKQFVRDPN